MQFATHGAFRLVRCRGAALEFGGDQMNIAKAPRSLRSAFAVDTGGGRLQVESTCTVSVACLVAVGSITAADAQQSLPPVTVDAPVAQPRPPAAKPSAEQRKVRAALRRAAARPKQRVAQAAPASSGAGAGLPADRDPYADPAAPYKADRLSSGKFTQPILNTPRSVTVLTKEVLEDKNATTLKDALRSTAGVTLGTGEGGNAFGDRFFIRGFDVRNDIFVDGVRDPAVSIRENFFTEQVEILRGPASTFAGRGTTGGAINIVTKQAADRNFYDADTTFGTDNTKRIVVDVNQVITPAFSVRLDAMGQGANIAGRDYVFDDRWGTAGALKWTPQDWITVTANYSHTALDTLPDFGVPYNRPALQPFTETGVPRTQWYGFLYRDFQKVQQDLGTTNVAFKLSDALTITNKLRLEQAVNNYIGTLPESPNVTAANPQAWTVRLNPQSRYQLANIAVDQTEATLKFYTGPLQHTAVTGVEVSSERVSIDSYTGLASEAIGGGAFNGTGSTTALLFNPPNTLPFNNFNPRVTGNPTIIPVDTKSAYLIETANYNDFILINGGVRYDDYNVSAYKQINPQPVNAYSGMFNYNAGLVVKPVPAGSIYAAYATASKPVGSELDGTSSTYGGLNPTATINQIFAPEQSQAAEVGIKWELFDRHLLATGALFKTTVENARETVPTGFPGAGSIVAGAAYEVHGIDLEWAGKITDKWSVFGGVVLMQSSVTNSIVPSNIGAQLANFADTSFNTLTKYQLTPDLEIGAQATMRSKMYGGTLLAANQGTVLPSFWRFDTFLERKITENVTAKLFVNNIFNKTYYDAFYQSAAPFVLIAPGRSASLVISARF
jgi:catecholate siderophore receptor